MGLGKTVQSIAFLCHIAETYRKLLHNLSFHCIVHDFYKRIDYFYINVEL